MSGIIHKRFPADVTLDSVTFLNNQKLDGELYALLQTYSYPREKDDKTIETVVNKSDLPKQSDLCKDLKIKSPKTYRQHLADLIEKKYISYDEINDEYILLLGDEKSFVDIPLNTLKFLSYNCRPHVIKIYIYLRQRYKYAMSQHKTYEFTLEEIGEHIGYNLRSHKTSADVVKYALELLTLADLVEYEVSFKNQKRILRLTRVNEKYKNINGQFFDDWAHNSKSR